MTQSPPDPRSHSLGWDEAHFVSWKLQWGQPLLHPTAHSTHTGGTARLPPLAWNIQHSHTHTQHTTPSLWSQYACFWRKSWLCPGISYQKTNKSSGGTAVYKAHWFVHWSLGEHVIVSYGGQGEEDLGQSWWPRWPQGRWGERSVKRERDRKQTEGTKDNCSYLRICRLIFALKWSSENLLLLIFSAGLVCNKAVCCRASHTVLHLGWSVSGLLSSPLSLSLAILWPFCGTWSSQKPLPSGILMLPAHLELKDEMRPRRKVSFFLQLLQPAIAS